MAHEFYQIMVGAPTMSLSSWKQLARWSIDYSCLSAHEKSKAHVILTKDWKHFCQAICDEYDGLFNGDEINDMKAAEEFAKLKSGSATS